MVSGFIIRGLKTLHLPVTYIMLLFQENIIFLTSESRPAQPYPAQLPFSVHQPPVESDAVEFFYRLL